MSIYCCTALGTNDQFWPICLIFLTYRDETPAPAVHPARTRIRRAAAEFFGGRRGAECHPWRRQPPDQIAGGTSGPGAVRARRPPRGVDGGRHGAGGGGARRPGESCRSRRTAESEGARAKTEDQRAALVRQPLADAAARAPSRAQHAEI